MRLLVSYTAIVPLFTLLVPPGRAMLDYCVDCAHYKFCDFGFQCIDAVGLVAGRASDL